MLTIRLTEPVVFLRSSSDVTASGRRRPVPSHTPPAVLRGVLTLQLSKPTKIKAVEVTLSGTVKTEWPEGIGSRRVDIVEENPVLSATTVYFQASEDNFQKRARRTRSLGPGTLLAGDSDPEIGIAQDREGRPRQVAAGQDPSPSGSRSPTPERPQPHGRRFSMDPGALFRQSLVIDPTQATPFETMTPGPTPREPSVSLPGPSTPGQTLEDLRNALRAGTDHAAQPSSGGHPSHVQVRSASSTRPTSSSSRFAPIWASALEETSGASTPHSLRSLRRESRSNSISEEVTTPATSTLSAEPTSPGPGVGQRRRLSFSLASLANGSTRPRTPATPTRTDSNPLPSPTTLSPPTEENPSTGRGRQDKRKRFSLGTAWQEMKELVRPARQRSVDPEPTEGVGRRSSRSRPRSPRGVEHEHEEEGSRGRDRNVVGKLGGAIRPEADAHEEWTEFRKGTYNWPISFAIPCNTPPSIQCDFGSVKYRLNAKVTRPGVLTPNITAHSDVTLIACPGEDDTEDTDNIIVEREWESQLRYVISLSGRSSAIGGAIPLQLTLMPLTKVSIYRLTVSIEEKVDYYAHERRIARHDPIRRVELLSIRHPDGQSAILPILSNSSDAVTTSPLLPFVEGMDPSHIAEQLLLPAGPWSFHFTLKVPDCDTKLHFTNKYHQAKIMVSHVMKIVMRVDSGTGEVDIRGKKKQFDIIVETPITLLACRCNPDWMYLPTYTLFPMDNQQHSVACICHNRPEHSTPSPPGRTGLSPPRAQSPGGISPSPTPRRRDRSLPRISRHRGSRSPAVDDTLPDRSRQFARLIAGEERENGEAPPSYECALLLSPRPPLLVVEQIGVQT